MKNNELKMDLPSVDDLFENDFDENKFLLS